MNFFEEITKSKKDFPKFNSFEKEVKKYHFNFYQWFAIGMFIVCFFLGIFFGNLFATCGATSYFSETCVVREFNFSIMIVIWFLSLLVSIIIFAIGHIIILLGNINKKLSKFNV